MPDRGSSESSVSNSKLVSPDTGLSFDPSLHSQLGQLSDCNG